MAKKQKPSSPDSLTMRLHAPGMSLLHRAGLGGLACTLDRWGRHYRTVVRKPHPLQALVGSDEPWEITADSVTLRFGKPENAVEYLKALFTYAFAIRDDGLICLPGQFDSIVPSAGVLADLQAGQILTFLQHGRVRTLAKEATTATYGTSDDAAEVVRVEYKACSYFKHQTGWEELVDKKGCLVRGTIRVDGPISPGTVIRHVAYSGDTGCDEPTDRMLPLYFAMIGCLPLPVNRGVGVLLVPEVADLESFVLDRPVMTPTTSTACQVAGAADGAFQAQVRIRDNKRRDLEAVRKARSTIQGGEIPGCYAMTFTPTPWASQQKSRVATIHVAPGNDRVLDRYALAMHHLPPRVVARVIKETAGRGKSRTTTERNEYFRSESVVRPLIAENLAWGRKWYAGFTQLMTKINPATDKPFRDRIPFERGGLNAMIGSQEMWDEAGERTIVQAVHEALRGRYGQIADENRSNPNAMKNRFSGEYDKWRLAFAGSKTADQFRKALCDLFSRAGRNRVLQREWNEILPMLRQSNWQHARDLALLGLCSYQRSDGKGNDDSDPDSDTDSETK